MSTEHKVSSKGRPIQGNKNIFNESFVSDTKIRQKKENPCKMGDIEEKFEPIEGLTLHFTSQSCDGKERKSVCSALLETMCNFEQSKATVKKFFEQNSIPFAFKSIQKGAQFSVTKGDLVGLNINCYSTGKTLLQQENCYEWLRSEYPKMCAIYQSISDMSKSDDQVSEEMASPVKVTEKESEDEITQIKEVWNQSSEGCQTDSSSHAEGNQGEVNKPIGKDSVLVEEYMHKAVEKLCHAIDDFSTVNSENNTKLISISRELNQDVRENNESINNKLHRIEVSLGEIKSLNSNKDTSKQNQELLLQNSELRIKLLSERDTWLQEKVELTRINGELKTQIEELKFQHSENIRVEREKFQEERESLQSDLWKAKTDITNMKSSLSDFESTSLKQPVQQFTDIKYTEGLNADLSSLGQCNLRWKGQDFSSTEIPFHLEKLYHSACPLSIIEKDRIAEEIRSAPSPVIAKQIADKKIPHYPEWSQVMRSVMKDLQLLKYEQNPDMKTRLENTKGTTLRHPVGDPVWRSLFPAILTEVRDGTSSTEIVYPKNPSNVDGSNEIVKPPSITFAADSCLSKLNMDKVEKGVNNTFVQTYTAQDLDNVSIPVDPSVKPVLVSNVGINNVKRGEDVKNIAERIQMNFRRIQAENPAVRIIYVNPICRTTNINSDETKKLNELMCTYCKDNFITLVEQKMVLEENEMHDDFHPNIRRGLDLYMRAILDAIPDINRRPAPFNFNMSPSMPFMPHEPFRRGRHENRSFHNRSSSTHRNRDHSRNRQGRF